MTINKSNLRSFPLEALKNIKPIITGIKKTASDFQNYIEEVESKDDIIRYREIGLPTNYFFIVDEPPLNGIRSNTEFTVYFNPGSETQIWEGKIVGSKEDIINCFKGWISFIISYKQQELQYLPEEAIQKKYEEEFLHEFIIIEDDADSAPFTFNQQIQIFNLLEIVETEINEIQNKSKPELDVLKEVQVLKEKIPSLTKNQAASALAKLYGHVKKLGISFLKRIANKIVDKGIEWVLTGKAQGLIDTIHQHL